MPSWWTPYVHFTDTQAVAELEEAEARSEAAKAQRRALKNWSRFLTALVVSKRVQEEYGASEPQAAPAEEAHVTETRQLSVPEPPPARLPATNQEDFAPSTQPVPSPTRACGPIISLEEMVAAASRETSSSPAHDTPPQEAPRKRRRIILKRPAPGPRRSARHAAQVRPSYDESDEDDG